MKPVRLISLVSLLTLMFIASSCISSIFPSLETPEKYATPVNALPITLTDTPKQTVNAEQVYLDTLSGFGSRILGGGSGGLELRLSPNGNWVLPDNSSYELDTDSVEIVSIQNPETKLQIFIETDFISPTSPVLDWQKFAINWVVWSPDSTILALAGSIAFGPGPQPDYLMLFNISDPVHIKKTIIRWDNISVPYLTWSPNSAKLLIWCGPKDGSSYMYDREGTVYDTAWIVDRQGKTLNEFSIANYYAPIWLGDRLFMIKDKKELWVFTPDNGLFYKVIEHDTEISIVSKNETNQQLLLFENGSMLNFLVFDLASERIVDRIPFKIKIEYRDEFNDFLKYGWRAISAPNYSAAVLNNNSDFWIFDWQNHELYSFHFEYNQKDAIYPIGWSPILNGFLVGTRTDRINLSVIRP